MAKRRRSLDDLYPGRWALLLTPVRRAGKIPTTKKWNDAALARWEKGTGRKLHLRSVAEHLASGGNIGLVIPPGHVVLDADSPEAFAFAYLQQAGHGVLPRWGSAA